MIRIPTYYASTACVAIEESTEDTLLEGFKLSREEQLYDNTILSLGWLLLEVWEIKKKSA